jgi:hypothetical protein
MQPVTDIQFTTSSIIIHKIKKLISVCVQREGWIETSPHGHINSISILLHFSVSFSFLLILSFLFSKVFRMRREKLLLLSDCSCTLSLQLDNTHSSSSFILSSHNISCLATNANDNVQAQKSRDGKSFVQI